MKKALLLALILCVSSIQSGPQVHDDLHALHYWNLCILQSLEQESTSKQLICSYPVDANVAVFGLRTKTSELNYILASCSSNGCYCSSITESPSNITKNMIFPTVDISDRGKVNELLTLHHYQFSPEPCALQHISATLLRGMFSLTDLILKNHNISTSDPRAFQDTPNLGLLDLRGNPLVSVPPICDLKRLSHLYFSYHGDVSEDFLKCRNASSPRVLYRLYLEFGTIRVINETSFRHIFILKELSLRKNGIAQVHPNAFQSMTSLKKLDLSHNRIAVLSRGHFARLYALEDLDVSFNEISYLDINWFKNMRLLEYVSFSHNLIHQLDGSFIKNRILIYAYFVNNSMQTLNTTFQGSHVSNCVLLRNNKIETIHQDAFLGGNITCIAFDNNTLSNRGIPKGVFNPLKTLKILSLNRNYLTSILECIVPENEIPVILGFANNAISNIHPNAFMCMNISGLNLSNNSLSTLPSLPDTLVTLKVDNNSISDICSLIWNLWRLEKLTASGNRIANITPQCFYRNKRLKSLSLARNLLTTLPDLIFLHSNKLEFLNLNDNQIDVDFLHQDRILDCLFRLEVLGLDGNSLHSAEGIINHISHHPTRYTFKRLLYLSLARNKIETIQHFTTQEIDGNEECIKKYPLRMVNFDNNIITYISTTAFMCLEALATVSLTGNNIHNLTPLCSAVPYTRFDLRNNQFRCNCHMQWLLLKEITFPLSAPFVGMECTASTNNFIIPYCRNVLTGLDMHVRDIDKVDYVCPTRNCTAHCQCYSYSPSTQPSVARCLSRKLTHAPLLPTYITNITLDYNDFQELNTVPYPKVTYFSARYCHIHRIGKNLFKNVFELRVLHFEYNDITMLPAHVFASSPRLKEIYLSHNRIKSVTPSTFLHLEELAILYLDNNFITQLDISVLYFLSHLTTIGLYNNPWKCGCRNTTFRSWIVHNLPVLASNHNISCTNSTASILSLEEADLNCNESLQNIHINVHSTFQPIPLSALLIISFGFIVTLMTFLLIRFRYDIEVIVNTCRLAGLLRKAIDNGRQQLDVFLYYAEGDTAYVINDFYPNLLKFIPDRQMVIPDRDFLGGGPNTDPILEAIDNCRRTILFLSYNFLNCGQCMFTFHSAHEHSLRSHTSKIIIILMEDIAANDIANRNMRSYLKNKHYIRRRDLLFWRKLEYEISPKRDRMLNPEQPRPVAENEGHLLEDRGLRQENV